MPRLSRSASRMWSREPSGGPDAVITVIGNAVYGYSLRRTRHRVRRSLDVAVAHRFATEPARVIAQTVQAGGHGADAGTDVMGRFDGLPPARWRLWDSLPPKRLALVAAGLFA